MIAPALRLTACDVGAATASALHAGFVSSCDPHSDGASRQSAAHTTDHSGREGRVAMLRWIDAEYLGGALAEAEAALSAHLTPAAGQREVAGMVAGNHSLGTQRPRNCTPQT